jgi:hypothetical protein
VVIDVAVAVSITAGFTVILRATRATAPDSSVAVIVSFITRATVELVDVSEELKFTIAEFAVLVSIVTPEFKPVRVSVFAPVPLAAVYAVVDAALPAVIVIVVGPVRVGAAFTITVTSNLAVPPCESVTVIVSR